MTDITLTNKQKIEKLIEEIQKKIHYAADIRGNDVIDGAISELAKARKGEIDTKNITPIGRILTTLEFEKGLFLTLALSDEYRSFGLEFFRNIKMELKCVTSAELALAESISLGFIQTLFIQKKMREHLDMKTINDGGVKYLSFLSIELDKAHKRYLNTLQILTSLKNPQMEMNVRAQTAIIGNNQLIQSNNTAEVDKVSQSTI
ncbi:MAG: hypothetical protein WCJ70_04580 [bacterium]